MNQKNKSLFFFVLFSYVLGLSYFQSLSQHWSAYYDMDGWVIYNSSLIASGYHQEFRDQPAFTLFTGYALIFKIISLFNGNFVFKIEDIITSDNSDLVFGNLFIVVRFVNSLLMIFTLLFIYKILRIFNISKLHACLALLIVSFSPTFYQNLFQVRTEILSVLTFLISFYFLVNFFKKKESILNLLLAGMFFTFSMLTSIKIIFLFSLLFILIPFLGSLFEKKINNAGLTDKNKIFVLCLIFYIVLMISYTFLEIFFINKHPRFAVVNNIDLKISILFNFLFLLYLIVISKFNFNKFKKFFNIFSLYLMGFILGIILILFLDFLKITQINFAVIGRLTNPFYYMSVYSQLRGTSLGIEYFIYSFSIFFNDFKFSKILFISMFFILVFSLRVDFLNKNKNLFFFKIILFFCIIFNIFVFNLRYFLFYEILIFPVYLLLLLVCLKNFSIKKANLFLCIIILYSATDILFTNKTVEDYPSKLHYVGNFSGIKSAFNRQELLTEMCHDGPLRVGWQYWVPRLNDNFFNRLCYSYKN